MRQKRKAVERLETVKQVLEHGSADQLIQLGPILKLSTERVLKDLEKEVLIYAAETVFETLIPQLDHGSFTASKSILTLSN